MKNLDFFLAIPAIFIVLIFLFFGAYYPEQSQLYASLVMDFLSTCFGWLVELFSLFLVFFLIWLAFSKYGKIRLGEEKPAYSNFSYASMIFTAGVGASLIYWGIAEPIHYLKSPPFFIEAHSYEAAAYSVTYSIFHWGLTGWAIYCFPAIPLAYAFYVKKQRTLRVSSLCGPFINKHRVLAMLVDLLAIFGTLAAFASSLSLTTNLLSAGLALLFNIQETLFLQSLVISSFILVLFIVMLVGFNKGISFVANITVIAAFIFALFVFVSSYPGFILNNFVDSLGVMFNEYFRMSLWTDPVQKSGFPQSWTQYYWLWYYAYLVMMGLFITRISQGRTIQEMILYTMFIGALGCAVIIGIFGGYALWAEMIGGLPVNDWLVNKNNQAFAVVQLVKTLPFSNVLLGLFLIIEFFLMLTSMSSASVAVSMLTTNKLALNGDPDHQVKILWAVAIALISFSVFLTGGGITTIKSLCVIAGLPMMFVFMLLLKQLLLALKNDYR